MKKITLTLFAITAMIFTSCSDEETTPSDPVESVTISNLYAPQVSDYTQNPPVISGEFTKFSFKEGTSVTGEDWDIAFRGTMILVNGGGMIGLTDEPQRSGDGSLAIVNDTFANVIEAPIDTDFAQDASGTFALPHGSGNGWYTYENGVISRIAGKVFVIKTMDGNYAKMSIKSYYKDNDPSVRENARYYTFDYVYNPNTGDKNLQ
ncbi:HmuY family protein [Tenacibaculum sp. SG-28]|uniref:HmuY family protein n=1 Tax=Tenacibaculum sp. SG-28 TaxID=754426 RepID=UPI000CF3E23F|nr:HmuY family protein [Tenacibaculum sp. SG-28]PQJ19689.1 hypothetical protein BSU00_12020 [Tenacibaculum sp. SG-28]